MHTVRSATGSTEVSVRPATSDGVRVVIGEDEVLLRHGLELLLQRAGFDVVAAVGEAPALLQAVAEHRPDVVVTDIHMSPGGPDDGLRAAVRIRVEHPGTGVLVVAQHVQGRYAVELLAENLRGVGYLLKRRIPAVDDFCRSVRHVAAGGTALDPEVVEAMMARAQRGFAPLQRLTARQREVLALVAEGCSNLAIAARLSVSEKAVVQHVSRIYDALDLPLDTNQHRRVLAVLRFLSA